MESMASGTDNCEKQNNLYNDNTESDDEFTGSNVTIVDDNRHLIK